MHTENILRLLSKILKNQDVTAQKTGFFLSKENRAFGQYLDNCKEKKEVIHDYLGVVNRSLHMTGSSTDLRPNG